MTQEECRNFTGEKPATQIQRQQYLLKDVVNILIQNYEKQTGLRLVSINIQMAEFNTGCHTIITDPVYSFKHLELE